jgi:hypothetical protein
MAKKKGKKMSTSNAIVPALPRGVARVEPDGPRYKSIFQVKSASSNRLYRISFDSAVGAWVCSCPGQIAHLSCKHLESTGLHPTRKEIKGKGVTGAPNYKKLN